MNRKKTKKNYTLPLEILVKVININTVKQSAVLERCKVLSDYSSFIDIVRHEKASGISRGAHDKAVETAHGMLAYALPSCQ